MSWLACPLQISEREFTAFGLCLFVVCDFRRFSEAGDTSLSGTERVSSRTEQG